MSATESLALLLSPHSSVRSSTFPLQTLCQVIFALIIMAKEGSLKKLSCKWSWVGSLATSGIHAAIYAVQNNFLQWEGLLYHGRIAIATCYTISIRERWRKLSLRTVPTVLLSVGEGSSKGSRSNDPDQILFYGIVPVLVASVHSGLASALCQWASQPVLVDNITKSLDGEAIRQHGFFYGWTPLTMGFVIVAALLVTALLQFIIEGRPPSLYCLLSLLLVISSISIYQKYPYRIKKNET